MKLRLMIFFLIFSLAEDAAGAKAKLWFRVLDDCQPAGSTAEVLAALAKDESERGLNRCVTEEKSFARGISMYRNCDELEGYELFGSSKTYCRWLANPKARK